MKTLVLDLLVVVALAVPGAALTRYLGSPQLAAEYRVRPPTPLAAAEIRDAMPPQGHAQIDHWGTPMFSPGRAG